MQKAPNRQSGVILTTFGAVIALWVLGGPHELLAIYGSMMLPPLVNYEIGAQCAGSAPQGRG